VQHAEGEGGVRVSVVPTRRGVLWLGAFALGTVLAMVVFSASVGGLAQRLGGARARLLLGGSSTLAVATGLWWLWRPLASGA